MTMKKFFCYLMAFMTLGLFAASCSSDEDPQLVNPEKTGEISFGFNLGDNPGVETRGGETTPLQNGEGACATPEKLQSLAQAGKLQANLTILHETAPLPTPNPQTYTVKIIWTGSKYISEPLLLPAGKYQLQQVTISDITTPASPIVLFSGVSAGASYASYVLETLPKKFIIGTETATGYTSYPLYEKSTIDLYVLCVKNETAKNFGFIKWNIHFNKLYCVPFAVNICDNTGEDQVGTGTITIKNGSYSGGTQTNGVWTGGNFAPASTGVKINTNTPFGKDANKGVKLGSLCFLDNYEIDNANEWYQITLNITSPVVKTIVGYANVNTLIQYNTSLDNAWDAANNFIHLQFCDCKTWFFPCTPATPVYSCYSDKFYPITTLNAFSDRYETYNGTTWVSGLVSPLILATGLQPPTLPSGADQTMTSALVVNKGGMFRTKAIPYKNDVNGITKFLLSGYIDAGRSVTTQIKIYKEGEETPVYQNAPVTINNDPTKVLATTLASVDFSTITPVLTVGNKYYVEISNTNDNPVKIVTLRYCAGVEIEL